MTFDDLRSSWQQANEKSLSAEDREEMIEQVHTRTVQLNSSIIRRDTIETIAAGVCILVFGTSLLGNMPTLAKVGAVVIVMGCIHVIYKLHRTRSFQRKVRLDASLREFCQTEVEQLNRQIQLLRSVLWWYIVPFIVGANMVFAGVAGIGIASVSYGIFTLFFAWGVYWLNQRAATKFIIPVRDELVSLFDDQVESK